MRVTLENESGETVVIEQSPDGRVKCEPGRKNERAANTAPPKESKTEAKAAKPKEAARSKESEKPKETGKPKEPARAEAKADDKPKVKTPAKARGKAARKGPLKWMPIKDHDYDGFAAASGGGQFKALIAKNTQWALFYELKGVWPKHIGCFRKVDKAKERAQELHDSGWPETEFGPITAGQVARACPMPGGQEEDEEMETATTKTEEKPAEPQPEPKGEAKTDAERDKELMGSFSSELESLLDEEEDD